MKLTEKLAELQALDFEARCTALEQAWGEDSGKMEMLSNAVDLVKKAEEEGKFGEHPLTDAQVITLAAEVVQSVLEMEKEAETAVAEETSEEVSEETEETEESEETEEVEEASEEAEDDEASRLETFYKVACLAVESLKEAGVTLGDLTKIASEEEAQAVGKFLANYLHELENNMTEQE